MRISFKTLANRKSLVSPEQLANVHSEITLLHPALSAFLQSDLQPNGLPTEPTVPTDEPPKQPESPKSPAKKEPKSPKSPAKEPKSPAKDPKSPAKDPKSPKRSMH